jgi:hypothetical protein
MCNPKKYTYFSNTFVAIIHFSVVLLVILKSFYFQPVHLMLDLGAEVHSAAEYKTPLLTKLI